VRQKIKKNVSVFATQMENFNKEKEVPDGIHIYFVILHLFRYFWLTYWLLVFHVLTKNGNKGRLHSDGLFQSLAQ